MNFIFFDECLNILSHKEKNKSNNENLIQFHFDENGFLMTILKNL